MKNSENGKLSPKARKLRKGFIDTWEVADPSGVALLDELCACFDRLQGAKAGLKQHGAVTLDRFGQQKTSPWFLAVRDETSTFVRLSKALNLEVAGPANRPGRPEGWGPDGRISGDCAAGTESATCRKSSRCACNRSATMPTEIGFRGTPSMRLRR
jgi:hypothetical protein